MMDRLRHIVAELHGIRSLTEENEEYKKANVHEQRQIIHRLTEENERAAEAARGAYDELLALFTSERARADEANLELARWHTSFGTLDEALADTLKDKAELSEAEQRAAQAEANHECCWHDGHGHGALAPTVYSQPIDPPLAQEEGRDEG